MKSMLKRSISFITTIVMLAGLFPVFSFAADGAMVLQTISFTDAVSVVDVSGSTAVTLTVPYHYGETAELLNGTDITFNTTEYTSAVASFQSGSIATVGGAPVNMRVSYQISGDETLYSTVYSISVVRAAYVAPVFSGTIAKSVTLPDSLTFSESDFSDRYKVNEGEALANISISGTNPSFGTLKLNGSDYTFNTLISTEALTSGLLSFAATDSGTVSYTVSAYAAGDSVNPVGTIILSVTVKSAVSAGTISYSTLKNTAITLLSSDFSSQFSTQTGATLSYVKFTLPVSTSGTLYYNYNSSAGYDSEVSAGTAYYVGAASYLSRVVFVPYTGYTGTVTMQYTAYTADGTPYTGTLNIVVSSSSVNLISYTTEKNMPVVFDASTFNTICLSETGDTLSYVKFTLPSAYYGTLYYNYTSASSYDSKTAATTKYYYDSGSPYLSRVTLVPYSDYTGIFLIAYTGYGTSGKSYSGYIKITANSAAIPTITYITDENTVLTLNRTDFYSVCSTVTGGTLSYVNFTLPSSSYGTLYYNYTSSSIYDSKVSAGTKYYYSASSYLAKVTLVPYSNYSGTYTISYTAYDTGGAYFTGNIKIIVRDVMIGTITYSTYENTPIVFNRTDFYSICSDVTGDTLSYVTFTLPSSSYGTLYYNYTSSSSYDSKVSASTKYYYSSSSSPYLSKVSFVPYTNYSGTVTVSYTAYDADGTYFTGTVKITVTKTDVDIISYSTDQDTPVTMNRTDFNTICTSETGATLSYVKFTLPSTTYGTLYYNYTSSSSYDSKVSASTKYYYSNSTSPYLSKVSFVPSSSYSGTVTITYKAYNSDGDYYTGMVNVAVSDLDSVADVITYTTKVNTAVTFSRTDFNSVCGDMTGNTLSYVKFTLPSSSYGTLYYNYTSASTYDSKVSASTKYYYSTSTSPYLSKISFVPYSGYNGAVTITYTAYDISGESYSGTMKITVGTDDSVIVYTTAKNTPVTFDRADFYEVCENETGQTLSYVKFSTLPTSTYGTLYYNYTSASAYDSKVAASTKYYYASSAYLSKVTFVPYTNYTGTVTLIYTAYNTDGDAFYGTIKITVGDSGTAGTISYTTQANKALTFKLTDFDNACDVLTGESLASVKFTLPSSYYGTLYYNYTSAASYGSYVTASTLYYSSASPYLSKVSFVPYSGYSGTVSIAYTGYNASGDVYTGTVKITVAAASSYSDYFTDVDSSYSWAGDAIDYLYEKGIVTGTGNSQFNPGGYVTRADFMLMLFRAFNLKATINGNFSDVAGSSYYYNAVGVAKALGIAQGTGGYFYPKAEITRQDAMVLIIRTLDVKDISIVLGSASDISSYTDSGKVSGYALDAVAALVKKGIVQGSGSMINPLKYIKRAEVAVILYRVLSM